MLRFWIEKNEYSLKKERKKKSGFKTFKISQISQFIFNLNQAFHFKKINSIVKEQKNSQYYFI